MATVTKVIGGDKFQKVLERIAKNLSTASTLKVGFLEDSTYPDGTSVPMVAAIQEFGAPSVGIPPRPFFRSMIAQHSEEWPEAIAKLLKSQDYNAEKVLELTGIAIKGQLQQSIVDLNSPPLAQSTIDRKGSAKPLVDTGHMLNSIDYEVE